MPIASSPASFSVYDLGSSWENQHGGAQGLASLAGRPVVIAMVYTHCGTTCPLIIETMKRLEAKSHNVSLVLLSLDPDVDDARALARYAREKALSGRWTLLRGSEGATRELAAVLDVRYRRASAAELDHSNTITILDSAGRIVSQQPSWDGDAALAALSSLR